MISFRQFLEAVVSTKRVRDPAAKGTTKRLGDAGFHAETGIADQLKKHSLMAADAKTGGSTGGHDFHVVHKKAGPVGGSEARHIGGESKISLTAKMGSVALNHTKKKGWHVSPSSESKKPHFARAVRLAKVNGKPFLKHLNDTWGDPAGGKHLTHIQSDSSNLHPVHAYMKDHDVHVLHIHTHGTFRGGDSEKSDHLGLGLPTPKGTGRMSAARERAGGAVHVSFRPHQGTFSKSKVDLMKDDHAAKFAKRLGH